MSSQNEHEEEEEHVQEILKSIKKKVPESAAFGGKDFSTIYTQEYLKEKKRTGASATSRVSKGKRKEKTTTTKKGKKVKRSTTGSRRTK